MEDYDETGGKSPVPIIQSEEKIMKWFTEVFLPSLEAKMNNPKYPNQCILTEKQADICYKYMTARYCRGDYGGFYNYEIRVNGKYYLMVQRGKYTFLYMTKEKK